MKEMDSCNYDDTGQRIDGENRWLWVFINKEVLLYHSSKSRSKKVVVEILGEDYDGVTVQDFYPSFDGAPCRTQKCWSHLIRAARDLAEKKLATTPGQRSSTRISKRYITMQRSVQKISEQKLMRKEERPINDS